MERRKYPIRAEDYELYELIGDGASASVRRARCIPFDEIVAVKILDFERNSDLSTISREAQTLILINHPNVLKAYCSFVIDHDLWVVMPYMVGGSCFHIMKSAFPDGFEEVIIATVLRKVLKGLKYLHQQGHIHRDIKAGNILVDASGEVKLCDLGVSAFLFDSGDRQRTRNTFVGTPCWMAPEVMEHRNGYDFKADIWSFGITALELAHGHAPFSSQPPVKVFLMTLQNDPPSLESSKDKKFSKSFKQMIAMCLVKDPSKRPTAHKLLKQSFFKQAKSQDFIARKILEGLPSLPERFQALKLKEAELLAQRKMLDGEKEAMSQIEYKRSISNWNFDIEDLKAEASLIADNEDSVSGKDSEDYLLSELDSLYDNIPQGMSFHMTNGASLENDGMMHSHSSPDQPTKFQRFKSDASANKWKVSGSGFQSVIQKDLQFHDKDTSNCSLKYNSEIDGRHLDNMLSMSCNDYNTTRSSCSQYILPSFKQESANQHKKEQNLEHCSMSRAITAISSEAISRTPKSTPSSSDDNDDKLKATVVKLKGRFKVTSETVDFDKAFPSPSQPINPTSQLEVAEEREKQLLQEIADLQRRLALSEEELKIIRMKSSQDADSKIDHVDELASDTTKKHGEAKGLPPRPRVGRLIKDTIIRGFAIAVIVGLLLPMKAVVSCGVVDLWRE